MMPRTAESWPGAAVDQQQVGPGGRALAGVARRSAPSARAAEAALEHLAHHGEVVAGRDRAADAEFAVGVLLEALRPGHDHHAIGVGAHDVAVVVDLDPLRRGRQAEERRRRLPAASPGRRSRPACAPAPRARWSRRAAPRRASRRAAARVISTLRPAFEASAPRRAGPARARRGSAAAAAAAACRRRTGRGRRPAPRPASASRACVGKKARLPLLRPPRTKKTWTQVWPPIWSGGDDVGVVEAGRVDDVGALHMGQRRGCGRGPRRRARIPASSAALLHLGGQLLLHGAGLAGQERLRLRHQPGRTPPR